MVSPRIRDYSVKGNLVADPQKVVTPQGRNLTTFTLAENTRVRDRQTNEWKDGAPIYYDVAIDADLKANGNLAQNVAESLKKGQQVTVEGDLTTSAYIDKEGNAQTGNRIWAQEVSPSMRFAQVQVQPNQSPHREQSAQVNQGVQAQMSQGASQVNHEQAAQQQMVNQNQNFGAGMY